MAEGKSIRNTVLIILGTGILFPFALPVVTAAAAFVAGAGLVAHLMGWRYAFNNLRDKESKDVGKVSKAIARKRYYVRGHGWDVKAFPLDMEPSIPEQDAASVRLKAAGIDGLVTAERGRRGSVLFSFPLRQEEKAIAVADFVRKNELAASVEHTPDGRFLVSSSDADVISRLTHVAFPDRSLKVEHQFTENRQYVIEGCSSYEEALQKFQKDRDGLTPANSFHSLVQKAEGMKDVVVTNGSAIDGTTVTLPTGAYVVTESSVSGRSLLVKIPGDIETPEAVRTFADGVLMDAAFSDPEVVYSDGTPAIAEKATPAPEVEKEGKAVKTVNKAAGISEKFSPEPGRSELLAFRITPGDVARGVVPKGVSIGTGRDGVRYITHSGGVSHAVPEEGLMMVKNIGRDNYAVYTPEAFSRLFDVNDNGTVSRKVARTTVMKPGLKKGEPRI